MVSWQKTDCSRIRQKHTGSMKYREVLSCQGVKRIRLHDLRHSHASLLISKLGAQPNLVADRLGHEKIQTTLSTYSHLYPDQSRKLADQLEKLAEAAEN